MPVDLSGGLSALRPILFFRNPAVYICDLLIKSSNSQVQRLCVALGIFNAPLRRIDSGIVVVLDQNLRARSDRGLQVGPRRLRLDGERFPASAEPRAIGFERCGRRFLE
ncbi:hypothetical protein AS156_00955 [Bradyrhizobium macuxiense]|uniref:Uncharacterized protein n=1 Tax=Bradyrhizobium macuxiense TaxID=1755647 RepID=A0A109JST6_9BRAD|nr:hypothetical protein AS156_00955 [Bradyrhizobium macuxiense]